MMIISARAKASDDYFCEGKASDDYFFEGKSKSSTTAQLRIHLANLIKLYVASYT